MVLAFSWVSSGRPAWRVRWSNQGTVARPSRASAHSAQAATPAHRWDPARGAAAVTAIVLTSYRRLLPASGIRDQCRWLPSQERYGQRPVQKVDPGRRIRRGWSAITGRVARDWSVSRPAAG